MTINNVFAQNNDDLKLSFFGQNYFGYAMNSEHRRQSNIYMTFDVAANYQTICANNNEFDYYYNYPILGAGISVSRFSEFVMEEGSFLPDVYTVYGSFERKLYNDNKYNLNDTSWSFFMVTYKSATDIAPLCCSVLSNNAPI